MRYVKFKRIVLPLFFIFFRATGLISRRVVIAKSLEQQEQTIEPVDAENIFSLFIPVVLNQAETGSESPNLGVPPGPIDPGEPEDPADPGDPSAPADPGDGEEPGDQDRKSGADDETSGGSLSRNAPGRALVLGG